MALSPKAAEAQAKKLLQMRSAEMSRLNRIREYLRDDPNRRLQGLPSGAPDEIMRLARLARVNMLKYIVAARVQAMYVDGFRAPRADDDAPPWQTWQRNRFDGRQIGVHKAAVAYGAAYVTGLPGDPVPVLRGVSPRNMTAAYGDDDEWPEFALERRRSGWRLYDNTSVYLLSGGDGDPEAAEFREERAHDARVDGQRVTPVVRYRETDDLDDPVGGIVEHLFPLQDQINVTTFGLLVAQHYGAFRQRYILGWLAEDETAKLKAAASKLWTFEDPDVKVGEFGQTDLSGYISSRETTLRHLATVSQTPAHELLGQLANMSAEALAAANESARRAITENQVVLGEGHEQTLLLAGALTGTEVDPAAEVRWRDTESRSLSQVADALGKLAQMLGVPREELWDKIPGVSQTEVERWKAAAAKGDPLKQFGDLLEQQAAGITPAPAPAPAPQPPAPAPA